MTAKETTDLFWRWRLRTRFTSDNGGVELAPIALRYSGDTWRDEQDLTALWENYRTRLEELEK